MEVTEEGHENPEVKESIESHCQFMVTDNAYESSSVFPPLVKTKSFSSSNEDEVKAIKFHESLLKVQIGNTLFSSDSKEEYVVEEGESSDYLVKVDSFAESQIQESHSKETNEVESSPIEVSDFYESQNNEGMSSSKNSEQEQVKEEEEKNGDQIVIDQSINNQ